MSDLDAVIRAIVRDELTMAGLAATPARAETVRSASLRLGVNPKTIRRLVERGELRAVRVGSRSLRVVSADIDRILEQGTT